MSRKAGVWSVLMVGPAVAGCVFVLAVRAQEQSQIERATDVGTVTIRDIRPPSAGTAPVRVSGRLMAPPRFFGQYARVHVWYDPAWKSLEVGDLRFRVGVRQAHYDPPVNGYASYAPVPLGVAPQMIRGHLYVPVEETMAFLGYRASWVPGRGWTVTWPR